MVPQLDWKRLFAKEPGPFASTSGSRPLRLTLYCPSSTGLSATDTEVLQLLREMATLEEIEAADSSESQVPLMTIQSGEHGFGAHVALPDGFKDALIGPDTIWRQLAVLLGNEDYLPELMWVAAHQALDHDVFVTTSPALLSLRDHQRLARHNIRSVSDAAKIVGLYLRLRGSYTWTATSGGRASLDRLGGYLVMARERTPGLWRYLHACVVAGASRKDDIVELATSVLVRCQRALEARDAIGQQFYRPQNNATRSIQAYHFDYLTLLLTGALDAQARVAYRAYGIAKPPEYKVNLWNKTFLAALGQHADASALVNLVSGATFLDLKTLLVSLRNMIHGSAFASLSFKNQSSPDQSLFRIPNDLAAKVRQASASFGGPDRWGLTSALGTELEPYSYAVCLADETLKMVSNIAQATAIERLLPTGSKVALMTGPPDNNIFAPRIRKRFAILD
jgi:hypothetical protein